MDDQNKNLILATALSFIVILVWFVMFPPPDTQTKAPDQVATTQTDGAKGGSTGQGTGTSMPKAATDATATAPAADATTGGVASTEQSAADQPKAPRVTIDTPSLRGSISLRGGRIDDLALRNYRETIKPDSDTVHLLSPAGTDKPYYTLYGWAPGAGLTADQVPGPETIWTLEQGKTLSPGHPVTLSWQNGAGLTFQREIAVDDKFMFTIRQTVRNTGTAAAVMAPYGIVVRRGLPDNLRSNYLVHQGLIGMSDGELSEVTYSKMTKMEMNPTEGVPAKDTQVKDNGWVGFTDHYWMTTLVPDPGIGFKSVAKYDPERDIYQAEMVLPTRSVKPGQSETVETRVFAGAKEFQAIKTYQETLGISRFVDSIDWGWFFFLTKPIFRAMHWLNQTFASLGVPGSMGWAIIALTFGLKAIVLPLAFKSYVSMAKMKELQPQMEQLKEEAGDDRQQVQKAMMELYKREKVNPASGCLPILLQIPIFFSLYKVIRVTIDLRHAPWIGWIQDLSAPDPSSLFNLWGLMPWPAPEAGSTLALVFIGLMPLLLGISMWLQQKLNPAPTDPTQKTIMTMMPWVFMFMLGNFASGLVLYWITNNTLTFTQQYLIMRSQGYHPNVLGNIKSGFKKKSAQSGDK